MKHKLFIAWFLMLFLVSCNSPGELISPNDISKLSVNGTGYASAVPDVVDINLGVDTVDEDPVEAVSQNTTRMNEVMALLNELGIPAKDIQTTGYSMWVEDVWDQENQLTGEKRYHVINQVNVRLRDIKQIGKLIEEATNVGVTNVSAITFGVADTTDLEKKALDNAIANANQKAEWIASNMNASIGVVIDVVEGGTYSPAVPYYGEKGGIGGGEGTPISQGKFSITTQVQVIYELIP
jgi:uncharacterized protein YggE